MSKSKSNFVDLLTISPSASEEQHADVLDLEDDGATRNRTPPWTATKYLRRPREKGLRHRRSINREVAWITGRLGLDAIG